MITCILYVICFIYGIIVLTKGEFKVSNNRVIIGGASKLLGGLLVAMGPVVVGTMFCIGVVIGLQNPEAARRGEIDTLQFVWIEFAILGGFVIAIIAVAVSAEKYNRHEVAGGRVVQQKPTFNMPNVPPVESNPEEEKNPYRSPYQ